MLTFVYWIFLNTRVCKPHPECPKSEVTNKTSHASVIFQKAKQRQAAGGLKHSQPLRMSEGHLERIGTILFFLKRLKGKSLA